MITFIQIRPTTGTNIELNDLNYPLSVFEIEVSVEGPSHKKMTQHGEHKAFHYAGAMTIHAEGHILGSGATPSTDYVTKRLALADAILPPTTEPMTSRTHGFLRLQLDGMSEAADAPVVCQIFSAPMRALFPANSEFMVTWKSFDPYFTGVGSQTKYQLG